jgi:hypothetical protein
VRFITSTQDFPGGSLTDHDTVFLFSGMLKHKFEQTTVVLQGSREINPSGFGLLLQTDRFAGAVSHNLTETVMLSLEGATYFVDALASSSLNVSFPQTRFTSISPKISWKFGDWWSLEIAYAYAERAVGDLNQWNFANSTYLMLTYGGAKWSVSR